MKNSIAHKMWTNKPLLITYIALWGMIAFAFVFREKTKQYDNVDILFCLVIDAIIVLPIAFLINTGVKKIMATVIRSKILKIANDCISAAQIVDGYKDVLDSVLSYGSTLGTAIIVWLFIQTLLVMYFVALSQYIAFAGMLIMISMCLIISKKLDNRIKSVIADKYQTEESMNTQ